MPVVAWQLIAGAVAVTLACAQGVGEYGRHITAILRIVHGHSGDHVSSITRARCASLKIFGGRGMETVDGWV